MAIIDSDVRVSPQVKEAAKELAYQKRVPLGALVAEVVASYADGQPAGQREAPTANIRYPIDADIQAKAVARAKAEGISLNEGIRSRLEALVTA